MNRTRSVQLLTLLAAAAVPSAASGQTTVTFQQGVNGYSGTLQVRVADNATTTNVLGSAVENYFLDGIGGASASPNQQDLIRFDNILGAGPGQVPTGSDVLIRSATLRYTTSTVSSADTGTAFSVHRLLTGFDASTTWAGYGPIGPVLNTHTSRGSGAFRDVNASAGYSIPSGAAARADVTQHVQAWANGAANHGLNIRASNTNGWSVQTVGSADPAARPQLSVTYEVIPGLQQSRFQQGVNGYAGTTSAWLRQNNTTTPGSALTGPTYLDGPDGGTSPNDQMLIKFDNLFGAAAGQVPQGATVVKAVLVLTNGGTNTSEADYGVDSAAESGGPWRASKMLVNWDGTSTFTGFGDDGPTEAQGEIGPALFNGASFGEHVRGEFDVTQAVIDWKNGQTNFGLNIQANGTADGWQVFFDGATDLSARPELLVYWTPVPEPTAVLGFAAAAGAGGMWVRRRVRAWRGAAATSTSPS